MPGIYIEATILDSKAFQTLTKMQIKIFFHFMRKRIFKNVGRGKKTKKYLANNGEIIFTYSEAENLGIPRKTFATAISKLVEVGFIDIAHSGNGAIKGDCSKYGFYDRWKKYGKPDFIEKTRPKDTRRKHCFDKVNKSKMKPQLSMTQNNSVTGRNLRQRLNKARTRVSATATLN